MKDKTLVQLLKSDSKSPSAPVLVSWEEVHKYAHIGDTVKIRFNEFQIRHKEYAGDEINGFEITLYY
ncbi:hypothetical protein C1X64_16520 [Pseudomonas sp. GW456-E7]|nr:hypothetical protein C1X64_16520 [Pseudomonas sp. GW456-E7]